MTKRSKIEPTLDLPMSVAVEELTGFEVLAIQKRYNKNLDDIGAVGLMIGAVWAYETRRATKAVPWSTIEHKTIAELTGYFAPEPDDTVVDEPDSDLGKES